MGKEMKNQWIAEKEHLVQWSERIRNAVESARQGIEFLAAAAYQPSSDSHRLSLQGWRLLRHGKQMAAQESFRAALHHDPYAAGAWLGLSYTVETREEQLDCLQAAFDLEYLNICGMSCSKDERNLVELY